MVDNSILIGKLIFKQLSSNEDLATLVGAKKIFPLVANNDTTYPFIVYARTSLSVEYCKSGIVENTAEIQVLAVSDKYVESLDVANKIRHILELMRYKDDEICVTECKLTSVTEEFMEDAYIQRQVFTIKINRYGKDY